MTIKSDIQKLDPGALVNMFVVEVAADTLRFHSGVNALGNDLTWQGNVYTRFPIEASGFELKGNGTLPRPKVKVANITGLLSALVRENEDLVGAKVTRKRTFVKYLDAVNFPGGINPTADSLAELPNEIYFVDRKSAETPVYIEFELAPAIDVQGIQIPRRQVIQNVCPWKYRSSECGWTGGMFDTNGEVTATPALDKCSKRLLDGCKVRFGADAELPFGGFPSAGLIR